MNYINYEKACIDIFNYLSIEALEKNIATLEKDLRQIATQLSFRRQSVVVGIIGNNG